MTDSDENLPNFKVVFVGDSFVGKTSIIIRFCKNQFHNESTTVGTNYLSKVIDTPNGKAKLNIWDTAGQERYRALVPMYCRNSNVAVIVFDLSLKKSFSSLDEWVLQLKEGIQNDFKIIIVGNKLDLGMDNDFSEEITNWCHQRGYQHIFVSAKTGQNIELLFNVISSLLPTEELMKYQINAESNSKSNKCC